MSLGRKMSIHLAGRAVITLSLPLVHIIYMLAASDHQGTLGFANVLWSVRAFFAFDYIQNTTHLAIDFLADGYHLFCGRDLKKCFVHIKISIV